MLNRRHFLMCAGGALLAPAAFAGGGAPAEVRPGDIVFRRGPASDAITKIILRWSPRDGGGRWSHAGVVTADLDASVVHAMPAVGSYVEPWRVFSSPAQGESVAVLRLRDEDAAGRLSEAAQALAGRRFDDELRLSDGGERLYCTELVWRAMNAAGIETNPAMISARPFYAEKIIHPDSLFDCVLGTASVV